MYNRYIPDGQPFAPVEPPPDPKPPPKGGSGGVEKLLERLKGLGLDKWDRGDLLLILVVLLLWREEEDTDLLLALGAAFFLGRDT